MKNLFDLYEEYKNGNYQGRFTKEELLNISKEYNLTKNQLRALTTFPIPYPAKENKKGCFYMFNFEWMKMSIFYKTKDSKSKQEELEEIGQAKYNDSPEYKDEEI